jgi:hypothetical protein
MTSRFLCLALFAFAPACGGLDVFIDGGTDGNTNSDGGPGPGPGPGPNCPTSAPSASSACSKDGMQCEYGGDARFTCNAVATCSSLGNLGGPGTWSYAATSSDCPTVSAPQCPAMFNELQPGSSCPSLGATCNYSSGAATQFCTCGSQGGPILLDGGDTTWQCGSPQQGCPAVRPHLGATCTQPSLQCDYDVCGEPSGLGVQCDPNLGTWVQGMPVACLQAN